MVRAAIYIRVSTDEQANQGNSLSEQEHRLRSYCAAMGWENIQVYVDDGYSAGSLDRPALTSMMKNVRMLKHDVVLTTKLDRLCRNLLDLLNVIDELEEYECQYTSATESFDTSTPAGRMVLQILGAFAEFERGRIRERVRENMRSLARNTNKAITKPCLGYDVVDGKFQINEKEAEIVRIMVKMILEGDGTRTIAKKLNSMGYLTKAKKPFTQNHIGKLLKREMLYGAVVYNRRTMHKGKEIIRPESEWIIAEDHHEGIISKEEYLKVQEVMQSRRTSWSRSDDTRYLLSGLVKCTHCGEKMVGRYRRKPSGREYFHYVCGKYMKSGSCFHHFILRDNLETTVISNLLSMSEKLKGEVSENKQNEDELRLEIELIKSQMTKLNSKMQRQIELYEDGEIDKNEFRAARERVNSQKEELQRQLSKVINSQESKKIELAEKLEDKQNELMSDDRLVVKNAIRQIVHEIDITDGEKVKIKLSMPN
ncbi:recombinase family protein [Paenibacillus camelliae]|uniref:recombinase family protein n=1 Tax=Paenibacillus camelliae TaxID=512410 RepID=UPI002040C6D5|nr:recombinase family protein [Paenibacillus camelliae]MCM3632954.1 recombinase family protein [Paenibacillus camelliae]